MGLSFRQFFLKMRILYSLVAGLVLGRSAVFEECDQSCERLDYIEDQVDKLKSDVKALQSQNAQLQERVDALHTQVNGPVKAASSCQEHWDNGMRENGVLRNSAN